MYWKGKIKHDKQVESVSLLVIVKTLACELFFARISKLMLFCFGTVKCIFTDRNKLHFPESSTIEDL